MDNSHASLGVDDHGVPGSALSVDPAFESVGICHKCIHRTGVFNCAAFPDGIPGSILAGDFIHTKPYPGDRGIQFELK